jgi:hypothetical protein
MKINHTTLSHPAIQARLLQAIIKAVSLGASHLRNRKGHAFMLVEYKRKGGFSFRIAGEDVTSAVLSLLKMHEVAL